MSYYMEVSSCPTLPLSWVSSCPVSSCPGFSGVCGVNLRCELSTGMYPTDLYTKLCIGLVCTPFW